MKCITHRKSINMQSLLDLQRKFFYNSDCKRVPERDPFPTMPENVHTIIKGKKIIFSIPKDNPLNKLLEESGRFEQINPQETFGAELYKFLKSLMDGEPEDIK